MQLGILCLHNNDALLNSDSMEVDYCFLEMSLRIHLTTSAYFKTAI